MSDNKALTLEQLREMDGQPVYCGDRKEWGIIHIDPDGPWANVPFFRGVYCDLDVQHNGLTLYAYPPAHIDREAWVSVEERLPEYNPGTGAKSYWVAKKDGAGNWQMKIAQYCDYGYAMTVDAETEVTWRDWDFTKIVNVTHWMSLPEPPDRRPPEGEA